MSLYLFGKTIGMIFIGPLIGLCLIDLYEQRRGRKGPVYTALTKRQPGLVFCGITLLSLTWVYSQLIDIWGLMA